MARLVTLHRNEWYSIPTLTEKKATGSPVTFSLPAFNRLCQG